MGAHTHLHGAEHTDGTQDIQSATNAQKGLATSAQITSVEANAVHAALIATNPHLVGLEDARSHNDTFAGEVKMGSNKITGLGAPAAGGDAANMDYVDSKIEGMTTKGSVDAATTEALPANTLTGDVLTASANGEFPTIDGVAAVLNQKYLVKNEGGGDDDPDINNGLYELTVLGVAETTPWELTRRDNFADAAAVAGAFVGIQQGTVNKELEFLVVNDTGTDVVNTDAIEFTLRGKLADHGNLIGLADDDHEQYHNDTRGDARYYTETELDGGQLNNLYFTESEHLAASAGAGDAGKPIKLDAAGHVDATMLNDADISHEEVGGLLGGAAADHYHMKATEHTLALDHKAIITMAGAEPTLAELTAGLTADEDWALVKNAGATLCFLGAKVGTKYFAVQMGEVTE